MAIITFPTILIPYSQTFALKSNTRAFRSTFTKTVQTVTTPGTVWAGSYQWPLLTNTQTAKFRSFLARLQGQGNRFYAQDYTFTGQSTSVNLTAVAGETTATLSTSVTVSDGDYIQVGTEFKMIVADSTGATITVEPPFRNTYNAQAADLNQPEFLAILDLDTVQWSSVSPTTSSLQFSFTEDPL